MDFLFPLLFLGVLASKVAIRERVEGFEFGLLFLPSPLASHGIADLLCNGETLCVDGFVKTVDEFLIVVPFASGEPVLSGKRETSRVFVTILLQHIKFVFGVTFVGNQSCKRLRGAVCARLH